MKHWEIIADNLTEPVSVGAVSQLLNREGRTIWIVDAHRDDDSGCPTIFTMPIEPPNKQVFEAACGYAELGMFHEANEQLDKIDPFLRAAPEILALRIEIYRGLEKWELMAELAERLAEFQPSSSL